MYQLDGKVALITGAANGMGIAHAELFVAEGAKVIAADIDEVNGDALAKRLGSNCIFVRLDVTDTASWAAAVEIGSATFGPINVLVNNAGVSGNATTTLDISEDEYRRTIEIDLHGTFHGVRAVLPGMLTAGAGSIVNIASTAGIVAAPGVNVGYVAAKFGVRGLTKQVAIEYASHGIRVNSVHPGAIRTPLTQALLDQLGEDWTKQFFATVPMNRIGESTEVSQLVVFLASDKSTFVTGSEFVVDGGVLAL